MTDYDSRRETEEPEQDSLEGLAERHAAARQEAAVDVDEAEAAERFELPGADLSGEELAIRPVPVQADEFTCSRCFLVRHRSQLADPKRKLCSDCA